MILGCDIVSFCEYSVEMGIELFEIGFDFWVFYYVESGESW